MEHEQVFYPRHSSALYGELNRTSVARLLVGAAQLGPEDTFVDVGSGVGKLVVLAAALTAVGAAWGVELSPSRHDKAVEGADRLLEVGALSPEERARVQLVRADCGDTGEEGALPEEVLGATHVLLAMQKSHKPARRLLSALRARPTASGRPRTIWSVSHRLPAHPGVELRARFELGVFVPKRPGPNGLTGRSAEDLSDNFVVREYCLEPRGARRDRGDSLLCIQGQPELAVDVAAGSV